MGTYRDGVKRKGDKIWKNETSVVSAWKERKEQYSFHSILMCYCHLPSTVVGQSMFCFGKMKRKGHFKMTVIIYVLLSLTRHRGNGGTVSSSPTGCSSQSGQSGKLGKR